MATSAVNVLSLCSGYGGLDLGVECATGGTTRTICYVEREVSAAAILAARMAEEAMDAAPIWSDLRTFDGRPWRGLVDLVTGGYPCQPFSYAGERLGELDERHLWPDIARVIGEIEPGIVFFENVAGHLTLGFDAVRADLERLGYRVAAGLFSAAEVGASHRRERLFILGVDHAKSGQYPRIGKKKGARKQRINPESGGTLADRDGERDSFAPPSPSGRSNADGFGEALADSGMSGTQKQRRHGDERLRPESVRPQEGHHAMADTADHHGRPGNAEQAEGTQRNREWRGPAVCGDALADSGSERSQGFGEGGSTQGSAGRGGGTTVANTDNSGWRSHEQGSGTEQRALDCGSGDGVDLFPPGPADLDAWRRILAERLDLAPAVESGVCGVADGSAPRLDRLRALGNGVVPLVAAYAFVSLWACVHEE